MVRCAFGVLAIVLAIAPSIARAEPATTTTASSEAAVARLEIDHTLANMRGRARHVRDLLRETRKKGDPKRIACLDEVLSRCDVAARHARELGDEVNAAYARNEVDVARSGHQRLIDEEIAQVAARRDASACLPPPEARPLEGTTVKVTVPRLPAAP